MFCKQILTLFLWCHCYQIVLNPLLHLVAGINENLLIAGPNTALAITTTTTAFKGDQNLYKRHSSGFYGSSITVEANQVALMPGHELALRCNITEFPDEQFSWYRTRQYSSREAPEKSVEEELRQTDKFIINNNVIIIKSPTFADVGNYYCRVKNPRDELENEKMILVRAKPYIYDFDLESSTPKSAAVEEGKSLKLPCNVVDEYEPADNIKVSWHMSKFDENDWNDVVSGEEGMRIETYNSTSRALIIDRVTKDHRRFYKCQVTNGITENSKTIFIRVRDKYTVLWPTVGIVIELVILIGVICVVENRKVEPDKDTYDRKAIQM